MTEEFKSERFKAAIKQLNESVLEQERELKETKKMLLDLQKLASGSINSGYYSNGRKMTYSSIAVDFLKAADRPVHINEIVRGICLEKNVPIGSIARTAVQTTLNRFMKRYDTIRKTGPALFEYNMEKCND